MCPTVPDPASARHLQRLENVSVVMAKAELKNLETGRAQIGRAVLRCFALAGVTQKEGAALLNRDAGQVQRWIVGSERPQFDVIFGVVKLRQCFVVALAEMAGEGVEVKTTIEIRRIA